MTRPLMGHTWQQNACCGVLDARNPSACISKISFRTGMASAKRTTDAQNASCSAMKSVARYGAIWSVLTRSVRAAETPTSTPNSVSSPCNVTVASSFMETIVMPYLRSNGVMTRWSCVS